MKNMKSKKYKLIRDKHKVLTLNPMPNEIELNNLYKKKYYQKNYGTYKISKYEKDEDEYNKLEAKIVNYFFNKKMKILDIGCGEGHDLKYFHQNKHKCFGLDYSDFGIKKHNKYLLKKIKFHKGNILDNQFFINEKFDVVYSKNFAEHVSNYYGFLKIVKSRLKKNGLLVLIVPNELNKFQLEYMRKNKIKKFEHSKFFAPIEHLRYFQPNTLVNSVKSIFKKMEIVSLMTSYPIEQFLLVDDSNYYKKRFFGKIAHKVRVGYMNNIFKQVNKNLVNYMEATAGIGIGRSIILIIKKND